MLSLALCLFCKVWNIKVLLKAAACYFWTQRFSNSHSDSFHQAHFQKMLDVCPQFQHTAIFIPAFPYVWPIYISNNINPFLNFAFPQILFRTRAESDLYRDFVFIDLWTEELISEVCPLYLHVSLWAWQRSARQGVVVLAVLCVVAGS